MKPENIGETHVDTENIRKQCTESNLSSGSIQEPMNCEVVTLDHPILCTRLCLKKSDYALK